MKKKDSTLKIETLNVAGQPILNSPVMLLIYPETDIHQTWPRQINFTQQSNENYYGGGLIKTLLR